MRQILRPMKKPYLGKIALTLQLLFLTACQGLKPFPTTKLLEYDNKNQVCGEYLITDPENFKFQHVKDYALKDCPAIFGFSSSDVPNVIDWAKDAKTFVKERCH